MRAFVLSGGGSKGPLQVGALRALLQQQIFPEMVIGCSAGALNTAFLARDLCLERLDLLAEIWRNTSQHDIYPGNQLSALWRIVRGKDSFFDNRNFYTHLQRWGGNPAQTFANFPDRTIYITATDLATGQLRVFGDDPGDRILDAMMASTALPPLHPPWEINGRKYVDGGTVTPLPLRVALERGATEIYALHIRDTDSGGEKRLVRGVMNVMGRSLDTMLHLQADHDLLLAEVSPRVRLHYIRLSVPEPVGVFDWSQSERLIEWGYEIANRQLAEKGGMATAAKDLQAGPAALSGSRLGRLWRQITAARAVSHPATPHGKASHQAPA